MVNKEKYCNKKINHNDDKLIATVYYQYMIIDNIVDGQINFY